MKGNDIRLRITKIVSIVLVAGGIMLLLYPLFTNVYSYVVQWSIMRSMQSSVGETTETNTSTVTKPAVATPEVVPEIPKEFSEAVLEIPSLSLTTLVLKGTSQEVLAKAPGWYEESALPGQGNTAIAGHLNTNGCWFLNIDKLKPGEEIKLKHAGQSYVYQVEKVYPVKSTDWSIVEPCGYNALTLSTCIAGDRSRRLVVRARQVTPISPNKTGN